MNYKLLGVILILALVGSSVFYYQNNKKVSKEDLKTTQEMTQDRLVVVYNNEGFSPKNITIKTGESIKFINLSDRKMWVASNDHPTHDIYPEFDQKDIVLRGGEYIFKFEKKGKWGFHNHLYSEHEGIIIVE